jgi:selenium metabolism protein YedF
MPEIDCRGKACPEPVIITGKALEQLKEGPLTVLVDDPFTCENVERFARSQGCTVIVDKKEHGFRLHIEKGTARDREGPPLPEKKARGVVVYINSNLLGVGEEALGALLMRAFLKTLQDQETKPTRLIFINSGVRLTSEGSEALDPLSALSGKGVEILSCGTCLDFYGLKEKLKVGRVSNMYEIVQSLLDADLLIRP